MKYLHSAGVVVYRINNKEIEYLLILHNGAGHWDFPKGKIELSESNEHAALRELKEETGLTTTLNPDFSYSYEYFFADYDGKPAHKTVHFFIGEAHEDEIVLSEEHTDFVWLPYAKALEQLTFKNAKELLERVENYLINQKELS